MSATELETLRGLAQLTRLALSEQELARLAPELARILAAFEVLGRAAPGAAASGPLGLGPESARTRRDEPLPSLAREELLAAAAASADGFFVVPKTVGGER